MAMGSRPREAASLLKEAFRLQIVASAEKLQPVEIYQRPIATPSEVITPKHLTTTETLEPMMQELRTYIHRELSDLKGDMVRQFCEQERIIQEQQEEIERLLKRLNQGGYACLLRLILFRGNNRIETQHQKCFLLLPLFLPRELPKTQFVLFPPILRLMVRPASLIFS